MLLVSKRPLSHTALITIHGFCASVQGDTHCCHISCKNQNLAHGEKALLKNDGELKDNITKVFACGANVVHAQDCQLWLKDIVLL
jgi:hypothetical protein